MSQNRLLLSYSICKDFLQRGILLQNNEVCLISAYTLSAHGKDVIILNINCGRKGYEIFMKRIISVLISAVMVAGMFTIIPTSAFAATKKVSLKKQSATLKISKKNGKTVYGKTSIKVKKAKGVKLSKTTFKSNKKKIAKVNKKGQVTAVKSGKATISVKVKYTFKKRTYTKKLTFKVKVVDKRTAAKPASASVKPSEASTAAELYTEVTAPPDSTEPTEPASAETASTEISTGSPETTEVTQPQSEYPEIEGDTNHCVESEPFSGPHYTDDPDYIGCTDEWGNPYLPYPTESQEAAQPTETERTEESTSAATDEPVVTDPVVTDPVVTDPAVTDPVVTEPVVTEPVTTEPAVTEPQKAPETFNEKLQAFSHKLYKMCVKDFDKNYVMSPLSVYMALSMLHSFGDENVKEELESFVGMSDEDFANTAKLFNSLNSEYQIYDYMKNEDITVGELNLSNSIWFDETIETDAEALKAFCDESVADNFTTPFYSDNIKANNEIREFIKQKTRGLIDQDFQLRPDTVFALINTLYFKDIWNYEGGKLYSVDMDFKAPDGTKTCKFLNGNYLAGQVYENEMCEMFYAQTAFGYKIKFIKPKAGFTLNEVMTPQNLYKLNQIEDFKEFENGKHHLSNCVFPSFKIDIGTGLTKILKESKELSHMFDSFYSEITGALPLRVTDVIHHAVIDVSDEGIEGAAVTIIAGEAGCAPDEDEPVYHSLVLDRAFGFLVTDRNDTVLFEGQVTDVE